MAASSAAEHSRDDARGAPLRVRHARAPSRHHPPAGGTLAELYALAEDRVLAEQPPEAFGFGRAVARS